MVAIGKKIEAKDNNIESKENNKPYYIGHRQRVKERLIKEAYAVKDYELLELVLGLVIVRQDTKPLAKELLERFGSIRGCFTASKGELESIRGFGPSLSTLWVLLRELMARYLESTVREKTGLVTLSDMATIAYSRLVSHSYEEVWLATVDNQNRLLTFEEIAKGGTDNVSIHVRSIIELALNRKASGIFLIHNHPGSSYQPSFQDQEYTNNISAIAERIGLRFLEHFIVTEKGCACLLTDTFIYV